MLSGKYLIDAKSIMGILKFRKKSWIRYGILYKIILYITANPINKDIPMISIAVGSALLQAFPLKPAFFT